MSTLKQLDRASKVVWCPSKKHSSLLASGTCAGTIDDSFESKSHLEIYDINLGGRGWEMNLVGSVTSKDCFSSIAWGVKGMGDNKMPYGVIAGGMTDGSLNIWNVQNIITKTPSHVSRTEKHRGQILGLEFHPVEQNLLASGASDGEVLIWDLASPKAPKATKPHASANVATQGVTAIAWNKKVHHIIASSNESGDTTVWDLRQKRSIINFRQSNGIKVRASGLAWNPDTSVQIAVSYANHPVAEIWDLRQSMTPKMKLEHGHQGSITNLAWNTNDSNIILTTGEDQQSICWEASTGRLLERYSTQGSVFHDIQWNPNMPNILSGCSYQGQVHVQSIQHTGDYVPKWYQRNCGASFGFGGRLVSHFGGEKSATTAAAAVKDAKKPAAAAAAAAADKPEDVQSKIALSQVVTEPQLVEMSQQFQQSFQQGNYQELCQAKKQAAASAADKSIWTFMEILFNEPAAQKKLLLKELGYASPEDVPALPSATPSSPAAASTAAAAAAAAEAEAVAAALAPSPVAEVSAENFFDNFAISDDASTGPADGDAVTESKTDAAAAADADAATGVLSEDPLSASATLPPLPSASASSAPMDTPETTDDKIIREALIVGDFKTAITRCIAIGRIADAIMFGASQQDRELWEMCTKAFYDQHPQPFIRNTMKNVMNSDLASMVEGSDLNKWKETLALLITYSENEEFSKNVNQLGLRLKLAGRAADAVACYMCSSNMEQAVEIWSSGALSNGSQTKMMAMHDAIEKISIFAAATNVGQTSDIVSAKYSEYASLLANEGDLSAAINYLRVASAQPSSGEQHCATLMDRIYRAQTTESQMLQTQNHQPPPFPFQRVNVEVDPNMIQRLQQEAQEAARKQAEEQARKRQEEMQRQQQEAQARAAREAAQRNQFSAQRAPATQWGQPQGMQQRQPQYGQPARPVQPQANAYHQPQQFHAQQPAANTFNNQQRAPGMQQQRPPQQQAPQQWNRQQPQPTPVQRPAPVPVQAHRTNAYKPPMQQTPYGQQPQARAPVPAAAPAFQQQNKYTPQTNQFQPQQQQQPQRQPMQQQQQQPQQPARQFTPVQAQAPAPVPVPAKQPTVFTPGASGAPSVNGSGMNGAAASAPAPATVAPELGPQHKQMQGTLSNCFTNLMSQQLKSLDRKKLSNAQPKLEHLYTILPTISPPAQAVLQELCGAIANNDFATAQKHHTTLVTKYWNGNDHWLPSLRTLVLIGKKLLK